MGSSFLFFLFGSDAFDFEYGTVILRMNQGLDVSHLVEIEGQFDNTFYLQEVFCQNNNNLVYEIRQANGTKEGLTEG